MKQFYSLFFLILFWWVGISPLLAQDCDCLASDNCPLAITTNYTGQVCYELTDALNDDLADPDQGICGVSITFTHAHIWDLELSLTSPSGQTVQLIGDNTNTFGTTNNMLWDILFVPCTAVAAPDTFNNVAFSEVWENDQSWPFGGVFTGSYYPVVGNCLEDFDSGPVNGTWCLEIDNQPSTYSGQIINFEVLLCDNAGQLCCDALGGNLPVDDFTSCEGDSSLLLEWEPQYGPIEPDTAEYDYTFVVSGTDGVIISYDTLPDLTGFVPGTYSICGLSFLGSDSLNIPAPDGQLTIDSLENNLSGANPWFCGDLSNGCTEITIVPPPTPVFLVDTICAGNSVAVGDSLYMETGVYSVDLQSEFGCDSTVTLDLTVVDLDTTELLETICEGDFFPVGDSTYTETGIWETLLVNQFGCDSLVILDLAVQPPLFTPIVDTICAGEAYLLGDSVFTISGSYSVPFSSSIGCDSTVLLDLEVIDLNVQIAPADASTCAEPQVLLDGSGSSNGPSISYSWTALAGSLVGSNNLPNALSAGPGVFELALSQAGCLVADTVVVVADTLAPIAEAGPSDTLTCLVNELTLDGAGSSQGSTIVYEWASQNGSILFGADLLNPLVDAPGIYVLTVTDTTNGCFSQDSAIVAADTLPPFVEAGPDQVIDCLNPEVILDGSLSYLDTAYLYSWVNAMNDTLSWQDSLQAVVSETGWYYLTVFNQTTGCQATDSVLVVEDIDLPVVEAGDPDTLDCISDQITLDGTGSVTGPAIEYSWSTLDGNIVGGSDQLITAADSAGTYFLSVFNTQNGCLAIDSVTVAINRVAPLVEAGPGVDLNCALTEWTLGDPNNTSQGSSFVYAWENSLGDPISTLLTPTISQGETYFLVVTDLTNGCSSIDSVQIGQNQQVPLADAGLGGQLTCDQQTLVLDGTGSADGVFIEYAWFNSSGALVGQTDTLQVDYPDEFCLVVTNGFNLCADTSCVEVTIDNDLHTVDLPDQGVLDCFSGTLELTPDLLPANPGYEFTWFSSPGGSIITNTDQLTITVDAPGTYYLEVLNPLNSCLVGDSIQVVLDSVNCLPQISAGVDGAINCFNVPFDTLQGFINNPQGIPIDFTWQASGGGSIFAGGNTLNPVVTEGTYVLLVTNTALNIQITDTVVVGENLVLPVADAGPDQIIDCTILGNVFSLDGTGSSQNGPYVYAWETDGGNIVSGANTLTPGINLSGLYTLVVTDTLNGCSSTEAVLIDVAGDLPTPCLTQPVQIPCGDTLAIIGDTCVASPPYVYSWNSLNGTIETDPTQSQISVSLIDTSGMFTVWVTDTTNQCIIIDSVAVFASTTCFPDCNILLPDILTCDQPTVTLNGLGSSVGPDFVYSWATANGNFCGATDSLMVCVDAPGDYELTVTDTTSGFFCNTTVEVLADTMTPLSEAGDTAFQTCVVDTLVLNGAGSSIGNEFVYQWTGPLGCISQGETTLNPVVACAGTYFLEVLDTTNGCLSVDSVYVLADTLPPEAIVLNPDTLTCATTSVQIDGQLSTTGPDILYSWTFNNQSVAGNGATFVADTPGTYCLTVTDLATGCLAESCVNVFQDTLAPVIDPGVDSFLDCSGASVQLSAQTLPNLEIQWTGPAAGCINGPADGLSVEVSCLGQYEFSAQDPSNGCIATTVFNVLPDTLAPVADAGLDQVIDCNNPVVTLDGTNSVPAGNLEFSWLTQDGNILSGETTPMALVDSAGWYFLFVEDTTNNCTGVDSVFVGDQTALPTADAGVDTALTCSVTLLSLNGLGSSQGGELMYEWTPVSGGNILVGATSLQPLVDADGIYELVVTNTITGCFAADSVTVAIDTIAPTPSIELPQGNSFTCQIDVLTLDGTNSQPFGNLTYEWDTNNGTLQGPVDGVTALATSPGQYQLEVVDTDNGCVGTVQVNLIDNVEPPTPVIAPPGQLTCLQSEVVLDATGSQPDSLEIAWSGPMGSLSHPDSLLTLANSPGTYTLVLTDLENGCVDSTSVLVMADLEPPLAVAQVNGVISCQVETVAVSGSGSSVGPDFTYEWSTLDGTIFGNNQNLTIVAGAAGSYALVVTDEGNGCQDTATVVVVSESDPIQGVFLDITQPGCIGAQDGWIIIDSVAGGTDPVLFSLNGAPFDFYQQYGFLGAGVYELEVEDINGCTADTIIVLAEGGAFTLDLGPDWYIDLGETVDLVPQYTLAEGAIGNIIWEPIPDPDCSDCIEVSVSPPFTTVFQLTIQDTLGCSVSDEVTVFVNATDDIYVPNIFSPNNDGVNDVFFIQAGSEVEMVEWLQIYDRWGELVFEARNFLPNDPGLGWDGRLRGELLNNAVFVWQAQVRLRDGKVEVLEGDVVLTR
jgi:gliding motility-associated-like protein